MGIVTYNCVRKGVRQPRLSERLSPRLWVGPVSEDWGSTSGLPIPLTLTLTLTSTTTTCTCQIKTVVATEAQDAAMARLQRANDELEAVELRSRHELGAACRSVDEAACTVMLMAGEVGGAPAEAMQDKSSWRSPRRLRMSLNET